MAKILIAEDRERQADTMAGHLEGLGHDVDVVCESHSDDASDGIVGYLDSVDPYYDFFILDIGYDNDIIAGYAIFVDLTIRKLRRKFKHLIICSKYADLARDNISLDNPHGLLLRSFEYTAQIPRENIVGKLDDRNNALEERIAQLLADNSPVTIVEYETW